MRRIRESTVKDLIVPGVAGYRSTSRPVARARTIIGQDKITRYMVIFAHIFTHPPSVGDQKIRPVDIPNIGDLSVRLPTTELIGKYTVQGKQNHIVHQNYAVPATDFMPKIRRTAIIISLYKL